MPRFQPQSFAEYLSYIAVKTHHKQQRETLLPVAREIANAKRIPYDEKAIEAVERSYDEVTSAQIWSHLDTHKLPFERVWLEGPIPVNEANRAPETRLGLLLRRSPDQNGFNALQVELQPNADQVARLVGDRGSTGLIVDNRCITGAPVRFSVNKETGIDLDDDKLLKELERVQNRFGPLANSMYPDGVESVIDYRFGVADFAARLIVMHGSKHSAIKSSLTLDAADLEANKSARSGLALRDPRPLSDHPIIVDLAQATQKSFAALRPDEPVEYQGVTSVCGHPYRHHGEVFWRGAHNRRTRSEGDRTNVERQLTSSNTGLTMGVDEGGQPARKITPPPIKP